MAGECTVIALLMTPLCASEKCPRKRTSTGTLEKGHTSVCCVFEWALATGIVGIAESSVELQSSNVLVMDLMWQPRVFATGRRLDGRTSETSSWLPVSVGVACLRFVCRELTERVINCHCRNFACCCGLAHWFSLLGQTLLVGYFELLFCCCFFPRRPSPKRKTTCGRGLKTVRSSIDFFGG